MLNKICLALSTLFICSNALPAEDISNTYTNKSTAVQVDTSITQGYRLDKLKFSIAGDHHRPNIISELTFKNIQIYQTRFRTQITKGNYFTKLMLGYGLIGNGKFQDSDYFGNNKSKEYSQSHHKLSGDYTMDAKMTFGKHFQVTPNLIVSPLIGYNFSTQKFRIKGNGYNTRLPHLKYHKLNSTYQAIWNSPLVGARAALKATDSIDFFAEYEFLFAVQQNSRLHWNMRQLHIKSKSPRKHGFGHIGTVGTNYKISTHCSLSAEYQLSYTYTKNGDIQFRYKQHGYHQPINKISLLSSEIRLAFNYAF